MNNNRISIAQTGKLIGWWLIGQLTDWLDTWVAGQFVGCLTI